MPKLAMYQDPHRLVLCLWPAAALTGSTEHVLADIKPVGTLFLNLLKMIACRLLASLVAGVASLNHLLLGRIGGKSIALYLGTTAPITIYLVVVNIFSLVRVVDGTREKLMNSTARRRTEGRRGLLVSIVELLANIVLTNPSARSRAERWCSSPRCSASR